MPFFNLSGKATRRPMPGADGADSERSELENKHTELIHKALRQIMRKVAPAGTTPDNITPDIAVQRYRDNQSILRDALVAMLTDGALLGADIGRQQTEWAMGVGKAAFINGVDWDLINSDVLAWILGNGTEFGTGFGDGYANTVLQSMATTSERQLRTLLAEWVQNDRTYNDLIADLERTLFSRRRAEIVSVTETTRSFAEGMRISLISGGVITQMRWYTASDEKVCQICQPLNGTTTDVRGNFAGGLFPPAHVSCRCFIQPYVD